MNIHVLMALAAFASVFMGNSLEGGLLLAMFNLAHIGKVLVASNLSLAIIFLSLKLFLLFPVISCKYYMLQLKTILPAVRWLM